MSSSESDDVEEQRLKEAIIDVSGFSDSSKNCGNGQVFSQEEIQITLNGRTGITQQRPSKRLSKSDDCNELNTTPEFKSFIARKLSTFLDSSTKFSKNIDSGCDNNISTDDSGFRLFSTSCGHWLSEDEVNSKYKQRKKRHKSSSSDSSSENERLAEAAVTEDCIFVKENGNSKSDDDQVLINTKMCKPVDKDKESVSVNVTKKKKKKKKDCLTDA